MSVIGKRHPTAGKSIVPAKPSKSRKIQPAPARVNSVARTDSESISRMCWAVSSA
jgi:hypothetical protein